MNPLAESSKISATSRHCSAVVTNSPITAKLIGSLTKSSVIRCVYRFAASSTTMATTVTAIASRPPATWRPVVRVAIADSGVCSRSSPKNRTCGTSRESIPKVSAEIASVTPPRIDRGRSQMRRNRELWMRTGSATGRLYLRTHVAGERQRDHVTHPLRAGSLRRGRVAQGARSDARADARAAHRQGAAARVGPLRALHPAQRRDRSDLRPGRPPPLSRDGPLQRRGEPADALPDLLQARHAALHLL